MLSENARSKSHARPHRGSRANGKANPHGLVPRIPVVGRQACARIRGSGSRQPRSTLCLSTTVRHGQAARARQCASSGPLPSGGGSVELPSSMSSARCSVWLGGWRGTPRLVVVFFFFFFLRKRLVVVDEQGLTLKRTSDAADEVFMQTWIR